MTEHIDIIGFSVTLVVLLAAIYLNNRGLDKVDLRIDRVEGRLDRIEGDMRRFFEILGEHTGQIDVLKGRKQEMTSAFED